MPYLTNTSCVPVSTPVLSPVAPNVSNVQLSVLDSHLNHISQLPEFRLNLSKLGARILFFDIVYQREAEPDCRNSCSIAKLGRPAVVAIRAAASS